MVHLQHSSYCKKYPFSWQLRNLLYADNIKWWQELYQICTLCLGFSSINQCQEFLYGTIPAWGKISANHHPTHASTTAIVEACKSLTRHVILVQGMDCKLVPPTDWDEGLYCKNGDGLVENYKVGGYIIRSEVSNICLGKMASTQLMRRADLIDCEVTATEKQLF